MLDPKLTFTAALTANTYILGEEMGLVLAISIAEIAKNVSMEGFGGMNDERSDCKRSSAQSVQELASGRR